MSVLVSVTVGAFADRRLLLLDASDGDEAPGELPFRESPTPGLAPPGRQGCRLQSDKERSVMVELTVHDAALEVEDAFEHAEFDGGGEQLALRGLSGDPFAVLSATADRWHLAARFYEPEAFWRLHLWPSTTTSRPSAGSDRGDRLFASGTTRVQSSSGDVREEPYVWVTTKFDQDIEDDRLDNLAMWLDQEIHLPRLDYTVEPVDLDKIVVNIRSSMPEKRLVELCTRVDAALGRIVRDVRFRTTFR